MRIYAEEEGEGPTIVCFSKREANNIVLDLETIFSGFWAIPYGPDLRELLNKLRESIHA